MRPTFLLRLQGENVVAEARYQGDVNLVEALHHCGDLLIDYGGHRKAAGFSIRMKHIEEFTRRIRDYFDHHVAGLPDESREAEIVLPIDEIPDSLYDELRFLAPFGEGNPPPYFEDPAVFLNLIKPVHSGRNEFYYRDCRMMVPDEEVARILRQSMDDGKTISVRMTYQLEKKGKDEGGIVVVGIDA
jgi:single-stranded-DNA-specific exonuclease